MTALRRPLLLLGCLAACAAGEAPGLRELVDRLKDLEAQVALIERESALPAERAALWAGAARGMVEAADPAGAYLPPDEVAIYGLGSEPLAVGCGFDWRQEADGGVVVTRVVRGSPAAAARLHAGARILAIDGADPARSGRRRTAEALARSVDAVKLRLRFGDGREGDVELKRVELADDGLDRIALAAPGIAVATIGRFLPAREGQTATATAAGLRAALAALPEAKALVLDLRGCAGGNLAAAAEIAAGWIPPGATVVEQFGRDPARSRAWTADVPRLPDLRLVLLVDGGTASSAEVLAHALRHHCRAPVVGMPTFGKGSVQQLFLLPRGDAIRLTVARLKSPSGAWLDAPLPPDVAVAGDPAALARRRHAETAAEAPTDVPDPQLARAVEVAQALLVAR